MEIGSTTALVTGTNRGLGRALVEALLGGGAVRVVPDRTAEQMAALCWRGPRNVERQLAAL
jgi:NAD(P)-dependent dehydrogenase (short-subunit alcohol dehydrogenase family)